MHVPAGVEAGDENIRKRLLAGNRPISRIAMRIAAPPANAMQTTARHPGLDPGSRCLSDANEKARPGS
jgi:hypothetical protein